MNEVNAAEVFGSSPISPRQTTLVRTPDLPAFRAAIVERCRFQDAWTARGRFVIVPSAAAAEHLRRSLEATLGPTQPAVALPQMGTRAVWYEALASRLSSRPRLLSAFEREVMLASAAREVEAAGIVPPFRVRPGLVAEMLELYDGIRRLHRTVGDFARNFRGHLEGVADIDRGAARLLQQTAFLAAVFAGYEARAEESGGLDEHGLRARLLAEPALRPMASAVVTVGDRHSEPGGLWPADCDLLTRLPALERVDIVATEGTLTAGLLGRLHAAFPGMAEATSGRPASPPRLLHPPQATPFRPPETVFVSRDREEELAGAARRIKFEARQSDAPPLEKVALVVHRPLPYLYLARDVLGGAGIPFETLDTLPLAAEPYASAVDVVLEWVTSDFARLPTIAVLRSPHFGLHADCTAVGGDAIAALGTALADARYLGGFERLAALVAEWQEAAARAPDRPTPSAAARAGAIALDAARAVAPLGTVRPMAAQIACLLAFLDAVEPAPSADDPEAPRRQRVRAAVLGALAALADAYERHDPDAEGDATALAASVRRWLGARTFATPTGPPGGVQIVDASTARYGTFDDMQLLGVIDGDWPERPERPVLFPRSLMSLLEPESADPDKRDREAAHAARASFADLLRSARSSVRVSTILLEHDAVADRSILIDEIAGAGLVMTPAPAVRPTRIFPYEAMTGHPAAPEALPSRVAAWALARLTPRGGEPARFHGRVGSWRMPRISVSRLERYLECPFRFFSSEVLDLEEEADDEDGLTPLERGRFLHEIFEAFFAEWQRLGHRRITAGDMDEARDVFRRVADARLAALPPSEAVLERMRLEGSAVGPGIAHRVFEMEAARPEPIRERLLEYGFEGRFSFHGPDGAMRTVALRGTTDRIDMLEDGSLRIVDYKSRKTPDPRQALQLPVYSLCARERLQGRHGKTWRLGEAVYLSFEGDRPVVPLARRDQTIDDAVRDAEARVLSTLDAIEAGVFPPRPVRRSLCATCAFSTVCRKDWVEDDRA